MCVHRYYGQCYELVYIPMYEFIISQVMGCIETAGEPSLNEKKSQGPPALGYCAEQISL